MNVATGAISRFWNWITNLVVLQKKPGAVRVRRAMEEALAMSALSLSAVRTELYLTTVAAQFTNLAEEAVQKKQSHRSYLKALLEAELEEPGSTRGDPAHFPAVKRAHVC